MSVSLVGIVRAIRTDLVIPDSLEPLLVAAFDRAQAAWPGVVLPADRFARFVAERLENDASERALASMHTDDIYLVGACLERSAEGLAAFEQTCGPAMRRVFEASGATPTELADLHQVVCQRLLVPVVTETGEREPRLAGFSGRGTLVAWVRVVAAREAARLLPRERRETSDDGLAALLAPDDDPEIGYLKRLYRAEFKLAFAAAIGSLSGRERALLKQHELDRLSIDELAAFYQVHRATTARWVAAARQAVVDRTRSELLARLDISRAELDSIMRLIHSQLEVSLPALLRSAPT